MLKALPTDDMHIKTLSAEGMSKLHLNANIIGLLVLKSSSQRFLRPLALLFQARRSLILTVVQNYTFVFNVTVSHPISHFKLP